jgi:hypothetical protein
MHTHPLIDFVCKEFPIFEFRVEFVGDRCRVLVEILSETCNSEGQAQSTSL